MVSKIKKLEQQCKQQERSLDAFSKRVKILNIRLVEEKKAFNFISKEYARAKYLIHLLQKVREKIENGKEH